MLAKIGEDVIYGGMCIIKYWKLQGQVNYNVITSKFARHSNENISLDARTLS